MTRQYRVFRLFPAVENDDRRKYYTAGTDSERTVTPAYWSAVGGEATAVLGATWMDPQLAPVLVGVIVLAVTGTTVLFLVGVVAYSRRQTPRYLLITIVLGLLVVRSVVGLGTVLGVVPMTAHHLVEHGFDFLIAMLVLYAVYRSGPSREQQTVSSEEE